MGTMTIFERLAALLEYPREDYALRVSQCAEALARSAPEVGAPLAEFRRRIAGLSTEMLQELYTRTFDLDPVSTLEVGWHLFGEQYERGEFLVKMRRLLARFGVRESTELPDHLTHALVLLGRMPDEEAADFAQACVFPALARMRAGFQGDDNPFASVLEAVAQLLKTRFGCVLVEVPRPVPGLRVLNEGGAR